MPSITLYKANTQIVAFKTSLPVNSEVITSFWLDIKDIKAMTDNNEEMKGIRAYKGLDNGTETLIACPTIGDDTQSDVVNDTFTTRPCPTMCGGDNKLNS